MRAYTPLRWQVCPFCQRTFLSAANCTPRVSCRRTDCERAAHNRESRSWESRHPDQVKEYTREGMKRIRARPVGDPVRKRYRAASQKSQSEAQRESQAGAIRKGQPWTPEEDRIVEDISRTRREVARLLNRSYIAVKSRRAELRRRARESTDF